jgi:DNA-binding phage protein
MLRDYVNATIGFKRLSVKLGRPIKSLQRMLGPNGNPTADNIFSMIRTLQEIEAVTLTVKSSKRAAAYPK